MAELTIRIERAGPQYRLDLKLDRTPHCLRMRPATGALNVSMLARFVLLAALMLAAHSTPGHSEAGDIAVGEQIAARECAGCHGSDIAHGVTIQGVFVPSFQRNWRPAEPNERTPESVRAHTASSDAGNSAPGTRGEPPRRVYIVFEALILGMRRGLSIIARPHEVDLVRFRRADSQYLDVARSRNYPMSKKGLRGPANRDSAGC